MAGIKEAMKRVIEHRNIGTVVAEGRLQEKTVCACGKNESCNLCSPPRYIIIRLEDGGLITQYDYGSDVKIAKDVKVMDDVILMIKSNWNAVWMKQSDAKRITYET